MIMQKTLTLLLLTLLALAASQQSTETYQITITSDPPVPALCFLSFHSKHDMTMEVQIDPVERYKKNFQDAQGFVFKLLTRAIKTQDYKSFSKYKSNDGDVLLLRIDDDVETLIIPRVELLISEEQTQLFQRVALVEQKLRFLSIVGPFIGVNMFDFMHGTVLNSMSELIRYYYPPEVWREGKMINAKVLGNHVMKFKIDRPNAVASSSLFIDFGTPSHLNTLKFHAKIHYLSKKVGERYILPQQSVKFTAFTKHNGTEWIKLSTIEQNVPEILLSQQFSSHTIPVEFHLEFNKQYNYQVIETIKPITNLMILIERPIGELDLSVVLSPITHDQNKWWCPPSEELPESPIRVPEYDGRFYYVRPASELPQCASSPCCVYLSNLALL